MSVRKYKNQSCMFWSCWHWNTRKQKWVCRTFHHTREEAKVHASSWVSVAPIRIAYKTKPVLEMTLIATQTGTETFNFVEERMLSALEEGWSLKRH